MLPWTPMSAPGLALSRATYELRSASARTVFGHETVGEVVLKRCLGVRLMKSAKG
jgi:hypothetical protein